MENSLVGYMLDVFRNLEIDGDIEKAMRRLHIKEVHLRRKHREEELRFLKKVRGLILK